MVLNSHSGSERSHTLGEKLLISPHATAPISEPVSPYISTALELGTAGASSNKLPDVVQRVVPDAIGERIIAPLPRSLAGPTSSSRISSQTAPSSAARSAPTLLGDSPVKARLAVIEEYRCDYVNSQRKAIIEQLGSTVPWGTSEYRTSIIPPLRPEFDIDRISDYLITKKHLKRRGDSYIWREFETKTKANESMMYNEPLENVFNAIIDAARETSGIDETPTLVLSTDGNHAPWSVRRSDIKPDGFLVIQDSDETKENNTLWYNIAACFAFKTNRHSNDEFENISQAVHSMQHVLAIDPCRRFTFGFNIEKTNIKLWIATRAMVISCESFDFQTQYKELIRLFLSLSFANKEELGWDMTVKPELERNGRKYDFEVAGEHYYTSEQDMIVGDKATDILGSGTRIWHARKGSRHDGDEVVIKDYWPSEERGTEDVLHRMILDDIKDAEKRQFFIEHTLNPIAAESVMACGKEDHTEKTILRGESPDGSISYKFPVPLNQASYKGKSANLPGMEELLKTEGRRLVRELEKNKRARYYHRKHHRIVYKEVATPFYKIRNTKEMYIVIVDALKTLLILHEAGWVHRDISAGNLYLYEDPVSKVKRGLIGDFEYAKKVGWGGQHDIRTGTPNFMAVEIARQDHQFRTQIKKKSFTDFFSSARTRNKYSKRLSKEVKVRGIFYNYIHDLESLWWIIVWMSLLYKASPSPTDEEDQERLDKQKEYYYLLFPGDMSVDERSKFLTNEETFTEIIQSIPHAFLKQGLLIECFREVMLYSYTNAEASTPSSEPIRFPDTDRLHDAILFQIPDFEFEEMEVTLILSKEEGNHDGTRFKGSKRRADDDPQKAGSNSKKTRLG